MGAFEVTVRRPPRPLKTVDLNFVPRRLGGLVPSDSRRRKEARNQALFRAVNEKIMGVLGEGAAHSEVLCECGHTSCTRAIPVSIDVSRGAIEPASVRGHTGPRGSRG